MTAPEIAVWMLVGAIVEADWLLFTHDVDQPIVSPLAIKLIQLSLTTRMDETFAPNVTFQIPAYNETG